MTPDAPRISILLPTLGRPDMLRAAVWSLLSAGKGMPPNAELLIGFQENDPTLPPTDECQLVWDAIPGVRTFHWPAPLTLARKVNRLAQEARGDILMSFANDMTLGAGWAERIIEVVDSHPAATVFHALDPTMPTFTTLPILRRDMMDAAGFFCAPWFPFWFTDTWWDEIGDMIGAKVPIDVGMAYQGGRGKTHGMRDLLFWAKFFERTRGLRIETARKFVLDIPQERIRACEAAVAHLFQPSFVREWEGKAEGEGGVNYAEAKRQAEAFLAEMDDASPLNTSVGIAVPSTGTWLARTGVCVGGVMGYSSLSGVSCGILGPEGSMITKQRNDIVEMARRIKSEYVLFIDADMVFPPDALVRLLRHKKDIVGATYCRRVPPYEALGRLYPHEGASGPPTDEELRKGGLWEAEFLPTGMLLVKMSVFDQMPWPWFAESYKFPGETGVDMLRSMFRQYWGHVAPDDVLDTIRESPLGRWADEMWTREGAGVWNYISEDINFCRNARKKGFRIWCDVGLTFEMRHVGMQEVTTSMPAVDVQAGGQVGPMVGRGQRLAAD